MYNVLYVDDDPNLLEVARFFLEDLGDFTVATSTLATDALNLPDFASYDAIISDYEMPGMDGITFLKNVREAHGDIPFILFTGKGREEVVIQAINNGADFYLQKGGDPTAQFAELAHKIKKSVERRRVDSALKESERILRINEERLVMAQRLGQIGSWEYDVATNKIWGSAEGLHIFGYPAASGDFPIADIESCIPERERVNQSLSDLITREKAYNLEYAIHPADGSGPRIIHSIARLEKDAGGNPLRVVGVIQDITERKRVEEEITFKNIILSTQQETSFYAILIVDENGKILNYNRRFIEVWGIPDALIASRNDDTVLQFVVGQLADPEAFLSRVRYLYDHKEERSFEELLLKDGRILERFSAPMMGDAGKYYGRVWYFRDISLRKKTERDLKKSETRFHSLYTNLMEGAALHELIYDDKGVPEDYVIVEANPAFEKHLGISRDTIIGRTSREAYHVDTPPYLETYARVALTGRPESFETYFEPLDKFFSISAYCPGKGSFATIFEDITERKRADIQLRKSEAKYRLLTENTMDVIYSLDLQGRITHVSSHIARYGYTPERLLSRNIAEIVFEEDLGKVLADFETPISTGNASRTTFRLKDAEGNLVWFEDNGASLKDESGRIVGVSGVIRDITERKRAEEENWKAREVLEGILNSIQVRVFWKDRNLTYLGCNTPFARDAGFEKPDDVIGKDDFAMGWREQAELYRSDDRRVVESGMPRMFIEEPQKTPSGDTISLLTTKIPLRDTGGNVIGVLGTYIDITQRKRAEEVLRHQTDAMEAAIEGLAILDADQNYTYVNKAHAGIYGYEHARDLIGTSWRVLYDRDELQRFEQEIMPELGRKGHYRGTAVGKKKDGSTFPQEISLTALENGGLICVVRDITERRRTEEDLSQANRKLNLLSGITRHDIKNQLVSLSGFLEISKKSLDDPARTAELIEKEQNIVNIIATQISFTKDYEDLGVKAPLWQNVNRSIKTVTTRLPMRTIRVDAGDANLEIFADALLEKVFSNLIDNALRYGGDQMTAITVRTRQDKGMLVITIEDDGAGISGEDKKQLFTKGFGKHTGLGLYLTREILLISGITIAETGEPGRGARFEMTVPKDRYRFNPDTDDRTQ